MFRDCKSLLSLPDISQWNTNNVTDMIAMFYECTSLSSLPDISKWNTNNVTAMIDMLNGCPNFLFPRMGRKIIKFILVEGFIIFLE
jgi:surface protein